MAAAGVDTFEVGGKAWNAYTTSRTKAMPKHSLFGTVLESNDEADQKALSNIDPHARDLAEYKKRVTIKNQYEPTLPVQMQDARGKGDVLAKKGAINKTAEKLTDREKAVQFMEEKAKYFEGLPTRFSGEKKPMTLAVPHLNFGLAQEMNSIGYSPRNAYNRDKDQPKPPVHKYSLIGDPFRKGMDHNGNKTETSEQFSAPRTKGGLYSYANHDHSLAIHSKKEWQQKLRDQIMAEKAANTMAADGSVIPANILHSFGQQLVVSLMADEGAVGRVRDDLKVKSEKATRPHKVRPLPPVEVKPVGGYGDLSHILRMNKFDGYNFQRPSRMKETHTQDVFDNREKDPDQFRHQWDHYGKWVEQTLIQEQQNRLWEQKFEKK